MNRTLRAIGLTAGASLLVAGSMHAASAPSTPPAPSTAPARVEVTGTSPQCEYIGMTDPNNPVLSCPLEASDPRVSGTAIRAFHSGASGSPTAWTWDTTLTGPDGTWVGHGIGVQGSDDVLHGAEILTGTGAYSGLVFAVSLEHARSDSETYSGVIEFGPPPPIYAPTPKSSTAPAGIGQPADDGARITAINRLDDRALDLTIESPALGVPPKEVSVRLLLPPSYDAQPDATWPVLYLLHGATGRASDWTALTDLEPFTADDEMLIAMPDGSFYREGQEPLDGWYTDWSNGGAGGPPAWETFHTTELPQLLERNFRAGTEAAIAGLSMGGYGALNYASRHPDLFKAAASFSGVLDLKVDATDFNDPDAIARWGDPSTAAENWDAHDPVKFAGTLKGIPLYVGWGNGQPGPLDPTGMEFDGLESWIDQGSQKFVEALESARVDATIDSYGAGTHTWPYWQRGLHEAMPMLRDALGLAERP